jgi:hypothetical protein
MLGSRAAIRGAKAKASGRLFENILAAHCDALGIKFEQLPSGCRWIGKRAIPAKSPFDFIMSKNGVAVVFDAKSIDAKTFGKSLCKPHQVESLFGFEVSGLTAGFIVWLRAIDEVVFFPAGKLKALAPRCSLKPCDGIPLGKRNTLTLEGLFNGR